MWVVTKPMQFPLRAEAPPLGHSIMSIFTLVELHNVVHLAAKLGKVFCPDAVYGLRCLQSLSQQQSCLQLLSLELHHLCCCCLLACSSVRNLLRELHLELLHLCCCFFACKSLGACTASCLELCHLRYCCLLVCSYCSFESLLCELRLELRHLCCCCLFVCKSLEARTASLTASCLELCHLRC